jgi:hypothetical protein
MTDTAKLAANLRDQNDMIGPIAFEAADTIERLTRERDEARDGREARHRAWLEAKARIAELTRERDEARQWLLVVENEQENANTEGYAEAKAHYEARIAELITLIADVRALALEDAAKVADGMRLDLSGPYPADREDYHFNDALEQAAENIRALKEPT